jgi:hypothetical protein
MVWGRPVPSRDEKEIFASGGADAIVNIAFDSLGFASAF